MTTGAGPRGPAPIASRLRSVMLVVLAALTTVAAGCTEHRVAPDPMPTRSKPVDALDPTLERARARARVVETAACGAADPARGSGLALDRDRILTAAHLVASGGAVTLVDPARPDEPGRPASVVAYDPRRDLAVLAPENVAPDGTEPDDADPDDEVPPPPELRDLGPEAPAIVVGGARSGDVEATVLEVTIIEMDDVRLPTRSTRRGYLIDAVTGPGDSGAGLYDADGRLAGLLFAVSTVDDGRSWVTAASEIEAFLADDSLRGTFTCDAERSRITAAD